MNLLSVRDHIPLEQGLRLSAASVLQCSRQRVRDHIPLEQGLRHSCEVYRNRDH